MKRSTIFAPLAAALCIAAAAAPAPSPQPEEKQNAATSPKESIEKLSEALGFMIAKNLEETGVQFDVAGIIQGLKNAREGKQAPMTETEFLEAITAAQSSALESLAAENLTKANNFLSENAKLKGIVSLEEGKIQYQIDQPGSGALVELSSHPEVRYTGKFLDGRLFSASEDPTVLPMEEIIGGLAKGMQGMHEGEKRTIFIHPDLAYGRSGGLPPNSLLRFEIEVVRAHVEEERASATASDREILERALEEARSNRSADEALR